MTANRTVLENLSEPNVQTRITELKAQRNDRVEVDADFVLKRLFHTGKIDAFSIQIKRPRFVCQ